jgi:hypothetical protein
MTIYMRSCAHLEWNWLNIYRNEPCGAPIKITTSFRTRDTTREPPNGYLLNFTLGSFTKICLHIPIFVKIGQQ